MIFMAAYIRLNHTRYHVLVLLKFKCSLPQVELFNTYINLFVFIVMVYVT